jgi:hypothetical protein
MPSSWNDSSVGKDVVEKSFWREAACTKSYGILLAGGVSVYAPVIPLHSCATHSRLWTGSRTEQSLDADSARVAASESAAALLPVLCAGECDSGGLMPRASLI